MNITREQYEDARDQARIDLQEQFEDEVLDIRAESTNENSETDDAKCVFILGNPDTPHICYQCGELEGNH